MLEFEQLGYSLRAEKLNAIEQFHLSRRVAPLIPPLAPLIVKFGYGGKFLSSKLIEVAELAEPFAEALAGMTDADAEHVFNLTLARVRICTDPVKNVWVPLWNPNAKMTSVVEFNEFGELLPIVIKIVVFNLSNFIDGLLTRRGEESPTSSGVPSQVEKTG